MCTATVNSRLRSRFGRSRTERAQLLSHTQNVSYGPLFDYPAINDTKDSDLSHRDLSTVRRFALKRPARCESCCDQITFRHNLFNCFIPIRELCSGIGNERDELIPTVCFRAPGPMSDEIGREYLGGSFHVAAAPNLRMCSENKRLVRRQLSTTVCRFTPCGVRYDCEYE
jgi:hypothetical protein